MNKSYACVLIIASARSRITRSFAPCIAKMYVPIGPAYHRSRDIYRIMPTIQETFYNAAITR